MLPPVCCLLLPPALAEEGRWMLQLFETALHSWWQWPRKTCRAREDPIRALGFHTPYTHSYFLCGVEWNFRLWYGWSAVDDLFIRRCLHKCVLRHVELPSAATVSPGSKGRTRGNRYLQCSSVCLRGTSEEPFHLATLLSWYMGHPLPEYWSDTENSCLFLLM